MGISMQIDWHCVCGDGSGSHRSTPDGEQCWGHCQKTAKDCAGLGYRPIAHTRRPAGFAAILTAAIDRRQPEHYTCDLSTDYQSLLNYEGRFIWICRQMGTHLFLLDVDKPIDREWVSKYTVESLRYLAREATAQKSQCYFWDGYTLGAVTFGEAVTIAEGLAPQPEPCSECGRVGGDPGCLYCTPEPIRGSTAN